MIVISLPKVEGPDGAEKQQHRARNEDHSSHLEQPCRVPGGLHGHGGVRLRGRRWIRCRPTHTRDPCVVSPGNCEDWSRKPWLQAHSDAASRGSLILRHGSSIADSSLGRSPSPSVPHPLLSQEVPSTPVEDPVHPATPPPHWAFSLDSLITTHPVPQIPDPRSGSGTHTQPGSLRLDSLHASLGDQEVLTGGLQNSTSSGPTIVIGTLSEFSVMAEDGKVRYWKAPFRYPNCPNYPVVPTMNVPCTAIAAAATAASCSGQPFCPHPF